ncbi:hypothetical protein ACWGB8_18625 [Kitasatospora sp. NPDC054939]
MSAVAVSAVLAGGLLLAAAPAQAAPVAAARAGSINVNIAELQNQAAELRAQAARLRHAGHFREANVVDAKARAIEVRIKQLLDCERSVRC